MVYINSGYKNILLFRVIFPYTEACKGKCMYQHCAGTSVTSPCNKTLPLVPTSAVGL